MIRKSIVSTQNFCGHMLWVSKNLDLRWGPTFCAASSGSKSFVKVINGFRFFLLAGKELRATIRATDKSEIDSFQNAYFLISQPNPMMRPSLKSSQTLWCNHSLESSRRDDFNEGHNIGFGWEIRKLSWKPFCSLFLLQ